MFNFSRFLARFCDYCLCFLAVGAITLFLPYFYGPFFYYGLALLVPLIWGPIEALFISKWGTTPGKALFGIWVRPKLTFSQALKRAFFISPRPGKVEQKSTSMQRKLFAFAASAAFAMAAIFGNVLAFWSVGMPKGAPVSGWVQYASTDVGFKISFPSDPQHKDKQLVIPNTGKVLDYKEITSSESENEKVTYSLSHMELPRKWRLAADTTLLKGALDAIVSHTSGAELVNKEFVTHQGHRAIDFTIKKEKEEVKGRLIMAGGTLYHLIVTYPPSLGATLQDGQFINSFELS